MKYFGFDAMSDQALGKIKNHNQLTFSGAADVVLKWASDPPRFNLNDQSIFMPSFKNRF